MDEEIKVLKVLMAKIFQICQQNMNQQIQEAERTKYKIN